MTDGREWQERKEEKTNGWMKDERRKNIIGKKGSKGVVGGRKREGPGVR